MSLSNRPPERDQSWCTIAGKTYVWSHTDTGRLQLVPVAEVSRFLETLDVDGLLTNLARVRLTPWSNHDAPPVFDLRARRD